VSINTTITNHAIEDGTLLQPVLNSMMNRQHHILMKLHIVRLHSQTLLLL